MSVWKSKLGRSVMVVLLVTVVATIGALTTSAGAASKKKTLQPDPNATLNIGGASQAAIATWDPANDGSITSDAPYFSLVYDRLFRQTPEGTNVVPMLATGYKYDSAGTVLTVTLRKGVKFDDGAPFNASVVVANLNRSRAPGTALTTQLANISDVSAVDDSTVAIKQALPDPTTPFLLAYAAGYMINPAGFATLKTTANGTGAFKQPTIDASLMYTFDRRANYWNTDHVYPAKIVIRQFVDENARVNALRTGVVDYTYITPSTYPSVSTDKSIKITNYPGANTLSLLFNDKLAPFNSAQSRQAISLGIDRAAVQAGLNGLCVPTDQFVAQGVVGHIDSQKIAHDVNKAKQMLQSSGQNGASMTIIVLANLEPYVTISNVIQSQLNALGLNVKLVPVAGPLARPQFRAGNDQVIVVSNLPLFADPSSYLDQYMFGVENPGTKNYPQLKSMLDDARVKPLGSKARATGFEDITKSLLSDPTGYVPICTLPHMFVTSNTNKVIGMDKLEIGHLNDASIYDQLQIAKGK